MGHVHCWQHIYDKTLKHIGCLLSILAFHLNYRVQFLIILLDKKCITCLRWLLQCISVNICQRHLAGQESLNQMTIPPWPVDCLSDPHPEKNDDSQTDKHPGSLGLRGLRPGPGSICRDRHILRLQRRQAENHKGIPHGRQTDVRVSCDIVSACQLHVCHNIIGNSSRDLCVRDTVLDDLAGLLYYHTVCRPRVPACVLPTASH